MIKKVAFYKVVCDHPGCNTETQHLGDFAAWLEPEQAEEQWVDAQCQWVEGPPGVGARHYCHDHTLPECAGCGTIGGLAVQEGTGDQMCPECMKADRG